MVDNIKKNIKKTIIGGKMKVTNIDSFRINLDYGDGFIDVTSNNTVGSVEIQTYEWFTYYVLVEDPKSDGMGRKIIFFPNKSWFEDWYKENPKVKIIFSAGKVKEDK